MAELVDAHGSGPCAARCGGSSPSVGTKLERQTARSKDRAVCLSSLVRSEGVYPSLRGRQREFATHASRRWSRLRLQAKSWETIAHGELHSQSKARSKDRTFCLSAATAETPQTKPRWNRRIAAPPSTNPAPRPSRVTAVLEPNSVVRRSDEQSGGPVRAPLRHGAPAVILAVIPVQDLVSIILRSPCVQVS